MAWYLLAALVRASRRPVCLMTAVDMYRKARIRIQFRLARTTTGHELHKIKVEIADHVSRLGSKRRCYSISSVKDLARWRDPTEVVRERGIVGGISVVVIRYFGVTELQISVLLGPLEIGLAAVPLLHRPLNF